MARLASNSFLALSTTSMPEDVAKRQDLTCSDMPCTSTAFTPAGPGPGLFTSAFTPPGAGDIALSPSWIESCVIDRERVEGEGVESL